MHDLRSTQNNLKVDKENLTIKDINVIQLGDIKDWRPYTINDTFINDLVKYANSQKDGILSNFGHNWDNLGKRLGRLTNFRVNGKKVVADLSIFKAAENTPGNENLGTYVMDLALEDEKAIMFSIRYKEQYYYQLNKGEEIKIWYYDDDDNWVSSNSKFGKIYPKFEKLKCVDVVDEGAATDSFFDGDSLGIVFNDIINSESFPSYLEENHEKFTLLNEFYNNRTKKTFLDQTREFLGMGNKTEALDKQITDLQAKLHVKTTALEESTNELNAANETLATQSTQIEELNETIRTQKTRITELEKNPSGDHVAGSEDDEGEDDIKLYHQSPATKLAIEKYGNK